MNSKKQNVKRVTSRKLNLTINTKCKYTVELSKTFLFQAIQFSQTVQTIFNNLRPLPEIKIGYMLAKVGKVYP